MQLALTENIGYVSTGAMALLWRKPVSRDCYVYVLYREDGVTPFYVGKGQGERWTDHERQAHRKHTYKNHVILGILAQGMSVPRRKVAENLTSQEACDLEVLLIAEYGRYPDGILTNRTAGGEGLIDPSPEVREAISRANKGRLLGVKRDPAHVARGWKMSEEARIKISEANKGNKGRTGQVRPPEEIAKYVATRHANGSYVCPQERRERIAAALSGRTLTDDERASRMEKMGGHGPRFGRKNTAEHNAKIAAAHRGQPSPMRGVPRTEATKEAVRIGHAARTVEQKAETTAKLKAAMTGRVMTDEHRANLTEANRVAGAARRGRPISDEHRANLKLAWEKRRQRATLQENP